MHIKLCVLLLSISWATLTLAQPDLSGTWSVSYSDSGGNHKAYVVLKKSYERWKASGLILDGSNLSYQSLNSIELVGGKFTTTMAQGNNTLYLEMTLGSEEMHGQWSLRSRDDDGRTKARDGSREYDEKPSPWYTARGTEHWKKVRPEIKQVRVTALENNALDYPKMKATWKAGGVMGNQPKIGIDISGNNLPIYLGTLDFVEVETEDKKLVFNQLVKLPSGDARLLFWLLDGTAPGDKNMRLNGTDFTANLLFKEYDDSKDFNIEKLVINDFPWYQQQSKLRDQIAAIAREINKTKGEVSAFTSLVAAEEKSLLDAEVQLYELGKKVDKQLRALRKQFPNADNYQNLIRAYIDTKKRIFDVENKIIANEELASKNEQQGKKVAAAQRRAGNKQLLADLENDQAQFNEYEKKLQLYLQPAKEVNEKIRTLLAEQELEVKNLMRIRERHRESLKRLQDRFNKVSTQLQKQKAQQTALEDKLAVFALEGKPHLQWVRVSDAKNSTVFFAKNRGNPLQDIMLLDPVIEQAKTVRDRLQGDYFQQQVAFEGDFENARYYLSELGGPTGVIMRNAYLQAGSESLFYLWDIAEAASKGGPLGAISELAVKTILAANGQTLTINAVDENKLRKILAQNPQADPQSRWGVGQFYNDVRTRGLTEALYVTVRDPGNRLVAQVTTHSVNRDTDALSKLLKSVGAKLDELGQLSKVLDDGSTRLGNLRDSKFSITDAWKSFGKDQANTAIKNFAMQIEEAAWISYFKADIAARGSYKLFHAARNAFWEADDTYQELLLARVKLVELYENYDYESGMTVLHRTPFQNDDQLRVSISAERENLFKENVSLDGFAASATTQAHKHSFVVEPVADKLNKKITLQVDIQKR